MSVETLNCPSCGGGVASDSTRCRFCSNRLKTVGCPKCFGMMFEGAEFCAHCGASVAATTPEGASAGDCPRCKVKLESATLDGEAFHECNRCSGLWLDPKTFERLCTNRDRQTAIPTTFKRRELEPQKISYVPCPQCKALMNRNNFALTSGVILDVCKAHGVWFDADELPRVVAFVREGGMERARRRQLAEIEEEKLKLRRMGRDQELRNRRLPRDIERNDGDVRGFVLSLFS